jgi:hypothetical protein
MKYKKLQIGDEMRVLHRAEYVDGEIFLFLDRQNVFEIKPEKILILSHCAGEEWYWEEVPLALRPAYLADAIDPQGRNLFDWVKLQRKPYCTLRLAKKVSDNHKLIEIEGRFLNRNYTHEECLRILETPSQQARTTSAAKGRRTRTSQPNHKEMQQVVETVKKTLAEVAPHLRLSRLNSNPTRGDLLLGMFEKMRTENPTAEATYKALARYDIETARKTPDKAPWLRHSEAIRHYNKAVKGEPLAEAEVRTRAKALERHHLRELAAFKKTPAEK